MRNNLNEKPYAEKIVNGKVRKNNMMQDLKLVAKYYNGDKSVSETVDKIKDIEERNKKTIEIIYPKIIKFAQDNYKGLYDPDTCDAKIMKMVKYYGLQKLYIAPEISFTKDEMNKIYLLKELQQENLQQRKLAFMLLLIAKIKGASYNKKYYVLENEWDFWKFAGLIDLTKDKRNKLLNQLEDNKLIKQTRLHNKNGTLSIEVLFVDKEQSNIELTVDDYTYPQYIYLKYLGKSFIKCEKCGIETPKNSNCHKSCKICSAYAKKESVKECMRKIRKKECDKIENDKKAI